MGQLTLRVGRSLLRRRWRRARQTGWSPLHQRAWTVLNASTAPVWLLMVLAPRWSGTRRVVDAVAPLHAALGVTYIGLLGFGVLDGLVSGGPRPDFTDGEAVARSLQRPEPMLAAWAHYLTFDLFVGAWIHRTALEEDIDARLALLLTWWAGPAGLTLFLWQRRRSHASHRTIGA